MAGFDADRMLKDIRTVVQGEVNRVRDEVIAEAEREFSRKLREAVGNIAIGMSRYFTVERIGQTISKIGRAHV